jgi:hypothetical protein
MTLYDFCKRMSALTVTLIIICLIIAGCLTSIPTLPIPTATTIPVRPSATSSSTPIPTKVSTFTPTPVVVLTPVRPTVDASIEGMWSSPNKSWIAALIRLSVKILPNDKLQTSGESEQRTILQVTDSAFTQKWIVEDIPVEDVMGYEMAWPLVWSHDGQYLYFTHRLGGGDGCFTAAQFYGTDLLKIT